MSTLVNWNGQQYLVPAYNDTGYAQGNGNLSQYLVALSTGSLQQVGGLFQLTADADFGPNFGLVSSYFKSRSANIASAGVLRLANTDAIKWRNSDNSADVTLAMNATGTAARTYTIPDLATSSFVMTEGDQTINGSKTFGSAIIGSLTGAASLNLLLTGGTMSGDIAMGTKKLTGLGAGTTNGDSLRYEQAVGVFLPLAGGTMAGNIAMGGAQKLTGLAAGSGNGDSLRYEQLIGAYLPIGGGTLTGNLQNSAQPCFRAEYTTGDLNVTGDGTAFTVIFNNEIFDQGSNYNPATGVFTAPVTGKYMFCSTMLAKGLTAAANRITLNFIATGGNVSNVLSASVATNTSAGINHSTIIAMTSGDTIHVTIAVSGEAGKTADLDNNGTDCWFAGYLVC